MMNEANLVFKILKIVIYFLLINNIVAGFLVWTAHRSINSFIKSDTDNRAPELKKKATRLSIAKLSLSLSFILLITLLILW